MSVALDFILNHLTELIITIIGVVISEVALYNYFKFRERPKITITTVHKDNRLGFNITTNKKMIKDARVRCNNVNYLWENEDGTRVDRKDLNVGDLPSSFFPYETKIEHVEDIKKYYRSAVEGNETSGLVVSIIEIISKKPVSVYGYAIPKGSTALWWLGEYSNQVLLDLSIRIIGEGIEEVKDYSLHLGLNNLIIPAIKEGKPIMDYVQCGFELKKK